MKRKNNLCIDGKCTAAGSLGRQAKCDGSIFMTTGCMFNSGTSCTNPKYTKKWISFEEGDLYLAEADGKKYYLIVSSIGVGRCNNSVGYVTFLDIETNELYNSIVEENSNWTKILFSEKYNDFDIILSKDRIRVVANA